MRQLLLLRHAKAVAGAVDLDRRLSPAGQAAVAVMRSAMRDLGLAPDLVLVSPSRRTLETLEGLEPWEDTPLVEQLGGLYLATAPQMLSIINEVAETVRSVLLVGHNPGLEELANALAGGPGADTRAMDRLAEGFPTASLAEFSVPGLWATLSPSSARLVRMIRPRDLAAART